LLWQWYGDTLFFSTPAFVLTSIIAIWFEIKKFFNSKK